MQEHENLQTMMYYMRSAKIIERRLDDDLALLDSETGAIFHLNHLGEIIWECMQQPVSAEDLVNACRKHYPDTPVALVERDVVRYLNHLLLRKILLHCSGQQDSDGKSTIDSSPITRLP